MQIILPSASCLKKMFLSIVLIVCLFLSWNQLKLSIDSINYRISTVNDRLIDLASPRINLNESAPKIHFVECSGRNIFTLKQLCVIESAANYHPEHLIQVWIFGVSISNKLQNDSDFKFIQTQYPNIKAIC